MFHDPIKKHKKLVIIISIIILYLVIGTIGYKLFGHQLITTMYEGKSIGILNNVMRIQSLHELKEYFDLADRLFFITLLSIPLFLILCFIAIRPKFIFNRLSENKLFKSHTASVDAIPDTHLGLWIALAAGLSLFLELMIIRLHSAYFPLFGYFKNISLLACFLGLGIGYARGSKNPLTTPLMMPFFVLQIVFMYIMRFNPLTKFLQNPISEQLTISVKQTVDMSHSLIVFLFLIIIFIFNTLCFIPIGQLTSRLMLRKQVLISYGWNLIGSLVGIIVFSLISFLWTSPVAWVVLALAILALFFKNYIASFWPSVVATIFLLMFWTIPILTNQYDIYSPYQIHTLTLSKNNPPVIKTNNSYYQTILDLSEKSITNNPDLKRHYDYYSLPYYFKPKPEDVLIVGSGTGNDAAVAIRNGAGKIDAVEIDPTMIELGKKLHPESPYQADNANIVVNDARAFIKKTDKKYDLIVYGLLDSNNLLSGKSGGIRLDSYVYTVEAFKEARSKLKDKGLISLTFALLKPELGRKLYLMLQDTFDGEAPIVYQVSYDGGYAFLAGEQLKTQVLPALPNTITDVTAEFADSNLKADKSTDNWPFFYMPVKKYPISYLVMIFMLLIISTRLIRRFITGSTKGFSIPCFFLGAGFMLVETKGITELALVYGSTWVVIGIVTASIMIMGFLANLLVMKKGNLSVSITYGLLFLSLAVGFGFTFINIGGSALWLNKLIMSILLTLPLFFSGFAFSSELKKSNSISIALSSNLLGAIFGGFIEYNSMYFGFRSLYLFALVMYALAFIGSLRINRVK